jgi:hypothetical protein
MALLGAVSALLLAAGAGQANTIPASPGRPLPRPVVLVDGTPAPPPFADWLRAAAVRLPLGTIEVRLGPCSSPVTEGGGDNRAGCVQPPLDRIELNMPLAVAQGGTDWARMVFFHEIGHLYDYSAPAWVRAEFLRIAPLPGP